MIPDESLPLFDQLAAALHDRLPPERRGLTRVVVQADGSLPGDVPRAAAVHLALGADHVVLRRLAQPWPVTDWPALVRRIEDLSPWAAEAVAWDVRPDGDGGVGLAMTSAARIEQAEQALERRGSDLVEVGFGSYRFRRDGVGRRRWARGLAMGWTLAMALGWGMALWGGWQVWSRSAEAARIEGALAHLAADAQATGRVGQDVAALLLQKGDVPSMGDRLDQLATALPQDSYLTHLVLDKDGFQIEGRSAAPEQIVPALAAVAGLTGVDVTGATTRDTATGLQGFSIGGQFTPAGVGGAP